jgi:hypothetical protein
VSLLNSNNNKAKAINALVKASLVKDVPIDVFLYLGKAYTGIEAFCLKRRDKRVFKVDRILEISYYSEN